MFSFHRPCRPVRNLPIYLPTYLSIYLPPWPIYLPTSLTYSTLHTKKAVRAGVGVGMILDLTSSQSHPRSWSTLQSSYLYLNVPSKDTQLLSLCLSVFLFLSLSLSISNPPYPTYLPTLFSHHLCRPVTNLPTSHNSLTVENETAIPALRAHIARLQPQARAQMEFS